MSALKRLASRDASGPGWWPVAGDYKTMGACIRDTSGHELVLTTMHTIGAGGDVTPSVRCGNDGCTYHEWVQLEDWSA